jgi:predicted enzyme related to lactoylglutathione lyase
MSLYGEIEMSALVIFSPNVPRLAKFYEMVLDLQPTIEASGDVRLRNDLDEVLVHSMPGGSAARIEISVPPAPREGSPMKPVFEVGSLPEALEQVEANGGVITSRTFRIEGTTRHDVIDPDGNVIQLRSRVAEPG